jgi:acetyltransferase-like isoleucine patch superfamily enzyme
MPITHREQCQSWIKGCILQIWSWLSVGRLRCRGVVVGADAWILGYPDVKLAPGSSIEIGAGASIFSAAMANPLRPSRKTALAALKANARLKIGAGAGVSASVLSCSESIEIGEGSLIGAECLIFDSNFHEIPLNSGKPVESAPVKIGSRVFIGARSIILPGVEIGDGAVIGAGSVVTQNIPAGALAAGNPARIVKSFSGIS